MLNAIQIDINKLLCDEMFRTINYKHQNEGVKMVYAVHLQMFCREKNIYMNLSQTSIVAKQT